MTDFLLVLGSVTSRQYDPCRWAMRRKGLSPKILRAPIDVLGRGINDKIIPAEMHFCSEGFDQELWDSIRPYRGDPLEEVEAVMAEEELAASMLLGCNPSEIKGLIWNADELTRDTNHPDEEHHILPTELIQYYVTGGEPVALMLEYNIRA